MGRENELKVNVSFSVMCFQTFASSGFFFSPPYVIHDKDGSKPRINTWFCFEINFNNNLAYYAQEHLSGGSTTSLGC